MATACDICGNRENEVKGGAGIEEKGTKITLKLQTNNPFFIGDGAAEDTKGNMEKFLKKLDALITGEVTNFTFILDDSAGNSYLQNLCTPEPDPQITIEQYTRNDVQNDRLGLLDMKTENYRNDES
ncbi:hypothetical protein LSH36_287g03012 [Paralvinella palmiformis]|uniref:Zinc finger ZPR1-type domain-containing protein n=1 Tax=Paralvinella palmiformis TaxID=53620 RepID=A0AAD9N365_9ANNE|nr:hypothetical protein LSH36_287g03012 [Paralvinella palmiformis]